ncbi:MAG: TrmH family RNA methyltransferase [Beutenbergiaceae bacterium]
MPAILSNPRADRVKAIRALGHARARTKYGQFLVEGPQGVREVVRYAPSQVRDLYLTCEAQRAHPDIVDHARQSSIHLHETEPDVLVAMSPDAQGMLAVVHSQAPPPPGPQAKLLVCLARVQDPGNAGTVIRAADAAGADAVTFTTGSVDPHNPKVVRSTAGSLFHLPVQSGQELADVVGQARARGVQILAADGAGTLTLEEAPLQQPTLWIFGNEAHGLSAQDRELADAVVRIPIHGKAESLNLAMAATLCLYASAQAQRS